MILFILFTTFFALVIIYLYIQWAYHRQLSLARKLPTAIPAYPLVGHLIHFRTTLQVGGQAWKLACGHCSGLSVVWLGPLPYVVISNASHMKVILNNSKSLAKADLYDAFNYFFGNGLLTAPLSMWKISRKHMNQLFHSDNINLPIFNETARHFVADLSEHDGDEMFCCEDYLFSLSFVNTFKLLFGRDEEVDDKIIEDLINKMKLLSKLIIDRICNPFIKPNVMFKLLKKQDFNKLQETRELAKDFLRYSQDPKPTMDNQQPMEGSSVKSFNAICNEMQKKDPVFNAEYVVDEMMTIISGGTETAALTMSSCLAALGSHPEIQKKLYEEIISVMEEGSEVCEEHIGKMTYLDQVLKETLRCFSTVPLAARKCEQDIQLDGHLIPKDTTVMLTFLGLNHNEEVFPDPLRFDPDRFSPENVSKRHSYSYLPFSGGPRNCIGKNYAMIAMKVTLVHLLRSYEIKSQLDIKNVTYKLSVTMVPVEGFKISIKKRS